MALENLKNAIRDIPDFPKPGIVFKDITPVLGDGALLNEVIDRIVANQKDAGIDAVVAIESRGFILGGAVAKDLNAGFVPIRKEGKLPWNTEQETYELEYGTDTLEIHSDAFNRGDKVLVVDDLLATGGSAEAAVNLVEKLGADVVACEFLIELCFLNGRKKLQNYEVNSMIEVEE